MVLNDGEIRPEMILKTRFLGKKGRFRQMVLVHGQSYELPYGEDFEVKNGGLRLAPIFGLFFLVDQYYSMARPEIVSRNL